MNFNNSLCVLGGIFFLENMYTKLFQKTKTIRKKYVFAETKWACRHKSAWGTKSSFELKIKSETPVFYERLESVLAAYGTERLCTNSSVFINLTPPAWILSVYNASSNCGRSYEKRLADDICTNNAFVWGDLNSRNQPSAFLYGETWTHVTNLMHFKWTICANNHIAGHNYSTRAG